MLGDWGAERRKKREAAKAVRNAKLRKHFASATAMAEAEQARELGIIRVVGTNGQFLWQVRAQVRCREFEDVIGRVVNTPVLVSAPTRKEAIEQAFAERGRQRACIEQAFCEHVVSQQQELAARQRDQALLTTAAAAETVAEQSWQDEPAHSE